MNASLPEKRVPPYTKFGLLHVHHLFRWTTPFPFHNFPQSCIDGDMSFSFNFSSDDIDIDTESNSNDLPRPTLQNLSITDSTPTSAPRPTQPGTQPLKARKWSLSQLLDSLPSQISYNTLRIPVCPPSQPQSQHSTHTEKPTPAPIPQTHTPQAKPLAVAIPRRSTHDILTHLKAEADPVFNAHETLISGLEEGDLSTGMYEGGFKTWECAGDLGSYVLSLDAGMDADRGFGLRDGVREKQGCANRWWVIELGAGSGVPSLTILRRFLDSRRGEGEERYGLGEGEFGTGGSRSGGASTKTPYKRDERETIRMRFTLCDYNEDVLRLCTAVNVMLTTILSSKNDSEQGANDRDLDLEEALPHGGPGVERDLRERGVTVDFISGPWGEGFMDLLQTSEEDAKDEDAEVGAWNVLVLASETIYSPSSLGVFTETVLKLLELGRSEDGRARTAKALVAAKKIYFGVGGGTEEFERCVRERGGRVREVWKTDGGGVGRVVLEVTKNV